MFYGTRFGYNLLYFFTAMSPAYFLFLLQIDGIFNNPFNKQIFGISFDIYNWCLLLLIILIVLAYILKKLLKLQFTYGLGTPVLTQEFCKFSSSNIEEINGNIISFLLGNIIPVVLIIENSLRDAIMAFAIMQILIFILMIKSSDIFPNILLIILGVDIFKTKNGNYLFVFEGKSEKMESIYQLGDAGKSKIYITAYKK